MCLEGAMWGISNRGGLHGRIDLETMEALAGPRAAISKTDVSEIDGVEWRKGKMGVRAQRSVKKSDPRAFSRGRYGGRRN